MFRLHTGKSGRYCDGLSRRSFVQAGIAGLASVGLPAILEAKARSEQSKDTKVILIWLDGGPSHMDLYDLKPEAPIEYRGIWNPIQTNVPGFEIGELFPLQAKIADKFSVIRTLTHGTGDHFEGAHILLTGRRGANGADNTTKSPSIAAFATKVTGARSPGMPAHVAVPYSMTVGVRPGYFGGHFLGNQYNAFETEGDPNHPHFKVNNLDLFGGMTVQRLADRHMLSKQLDRLAQDLDNNSTARAIGQFEAQAYDMVVGHGAREAFDLSRVHDDVRNRYGRHSWGQSVLLARRLAAAGTTWVTCHFGGWDHHWNLKQGMENYLPMVDQCVSALFEDLAQTGELENTLVLMLGEFSRTPRMNDGGNGGAPGSMGTPGRDHWGETMFCLIGGGGLRGGQIVGKTNRLGEAPKDRIVTPADLHHTIFRVLGVDPHLSFLNHQGRPITALEPGEVIQELI